MERRVRALSETDKRVKGNIERERERWKERKQERIFAIGSEMLQRRRGTITTPMSGTAHRVRDTIAQRHVDHIAITVAVTIIVGVVVIVESVGKRVKVQIDHLNDTRVDVGP